MFGNVSWREKRKAQKTERFGGIKNKVYLCGDMWWCAKYEIHRGGYIMRVVVGVVICLLMIVGLSACKGEKRKHIMPADITLQAGDIVFRRGVGAMSRMVRMADNQGTYSHVGLVVNVGDSLTIIHAVPDEPDYEGDYDRVKMDSPERFYGTMYAAAGEVKRLREMDSVIVRQATAYAYEAYRAGVAFDHAYDDMDTSKLYCCELIERAYLLSGIAISEGQRHSLFCPGLGDIYCILPSDILQSSYLETVYQFN